MEVLATFELERLVRESFPAKRSFSAEAELGTGTQRLPVVTFVHGGPDPFLDRQFDAWLEGKPTFVVAAARRPAARAAACPPPCRRCPRARCRARRGRTR